MQSTGVYWIPLYDILEKHGLRVVLVNAQHTQNVPGRKTDVQECQWLMKLHTYGLLRDSFRLAQNMEGVRAVWSSRPDRQHPLAGAGRAGCALSRPGGLGGRRRPISHFAYLTNRAIAASNSFG
jgi:hypothetical protein